MSTVNMTNPAVLLDFWALGLPRPKGSLKPVGRIGQRARLIEQVDPKKIWRGEVAKSAALAYSTWGLSESIDCPIGVNMTFIFPRPKKPKFDVPASRSVGDIDKLQRNVFDALQDAYVISDDALAISVCVEKAYAAVGEEPGVHVTIWRAA